MKITKSAVIASFLFFAAAAPALAMIPSMFPDICGFSVCRQFTQTTALAQIQSLYNQLSMLANETTNLNSIGNIARQTISPNVGAITSGAPPLSVGDSAAQQTIFQSTASAQNIAKVDTIAQSANGAQQQAQVSNLYLSTIAGESVKSNALTAEEQVQRQNSSSAEMNGLQQLFSGQVSTTVEQP